MRDPDLGFLTITAVRPSGDRGVAKIYYTVMPLAGENEGGHHGAEPQGLPGMRRGLPAHPAGGAPRAAPGARSWRFFPDATLEEGNKMEELFTELESVARPPSDEPATDGEEKFDGARPFSGARLVHKPVGPSSSAS
ncbi:MAG: hypothetical protein IPL96_17915 [Holophagaceae bacterium]|nr:hypothetical protein [Holophagaceae bacterium]